jgi:hypothetical protein
VRPSTSLPSPASSRVLVGGGGRGAEHVAEGDDLPVGVGDLHADRGLAWDRCHEPHGGAAGGVGEVLGQRGDFFDLDAGPEADLVPGHRGPAGESGHLCVELELGQDVTERGHHRLARAGARQGRRAGPQQPKRRAHIPAVAGRRLRRVIAVSIRDGSGARPCQVLAASGRRKAGRVWLAGQVRDRIGRGVGDLHHLSRSLAWGVPHRHLGPLARDWPA